MSERGVEIVRGVIETPIERELLDLAETIRREHDAVVEAAGSMVRHALAAGEALLATKVLVAPGRWGQWVEENLPHGLRKSMCRHYMRLAALREHVDPDLSIAANVKLLRGMEPVSKGTPRVEAERKAEALRLHDTGQFTRAEIARRVGVSKDTMRAWIDPEFAQRKADASNESRKRHREAMLLEAHPEIAYDEEARRAFRYGEPGRAAIGRAVRRLAQSTGEVGTREALLDLAAISKAWAARLDGSKRLKAAA